MSIRAQVIFTMVAVIGLFGCGTSYVPSSLPHTYVTNTQTYHQPTGIVISHRDGGGSVGTAAAAALFATTSYIDVFVDGRRALRVGGFDDVETFVQLPPGEHVIGIVGTGGGLLTVGWGSQLIGEYSFSLSPGQRGQVDIDAWLDTTRPGGQFVGKGGVFSGVNATLLRSDIKR